MANVLIAGGVVGALVGVLLLRLLRQIGQAGLLISLTYVVFLGAIGLLMLIESLRVIQTARSGKPVPARRASAHNWIHGLPLKMRFPTSRLYISTIPPLVIGAVVGLLAAFLGAGGGFIMVPAMIYLLRMPTNIVIGTSIFQIIFVTAIVTVLQATFNYSLDVVLALILAACAQADPAPEVAPDVVPEVIAPVPVAAPERIVLAAVGDVLPHRTVRAAAAARRLTVASRIARTWASFWIIPRRPSAGPQGKRPLTVR